jgi:hypothetical protein
VAELFQKQKKRKSFETFSNQKFSAFQLPCEGGMNRASQHQLSPEGITGSL